MKHRNEDQTIQELERLVRSLKAQNKKLKEENKELSIDASYGILTRKAFERRAAKLVSEIGFVVFLDIDYLHRMNEEIGHEESNRRIRASLKFRSTDIILKPGKWYSGDEVAILLKGSPEDFVERLKGSFSENGLSASIAWVPFSGDLLGDVESAKVEVMKQKAARGGSR